MSPPKRGRMLELDHWLAAPRHLSARSAARLPHDLIILTSMCLARRPRASVAFDRGAICGGWSMPEYSPELIQTMRAVLDEVTTKIPLGSAAQLSRSGLHRRGRLDLRSARSDVAHGACALRGGEPQRQLKPEMYATVTIGVPGIQALAVPIGAGPAPVRSDDCVRRAGADARRAIALRSASGLGRRR